MKAIALISGGLDSSLAAKLIKGLGVELIALNTVTPFCLCNHHSSSGCFHTTHQTAKNLGLKLVTIDVSGEILKIVERPKHGYGSNMNPCIDCRILLFKKAKEAMDKERASFVITGEVVGQRPMSQKLNTMLLIEREAGLEDLVLRPLSAKILKPTLPEREGWVRRDKLLSFSGRGRSQQIALAKELGINDYPCPSGGCLLTDPQYSKRLRDLLDHGEFNLSNVRMLRWGRHFRLNAQTKIAIGRNESENNQLASLAEPGDYVFIPDSKVAGPTSLGRGVFNEELLRLSCRIISRYCDLNGKTSVDITYSQKAGTQPQSQALNLSVSPLGPEELINLRI